MADGESSERPSPYLDSLSGDAAERITAMKWARYLGAAFGPSGAMSALRYYVEIGWISDDVRRAMVDYVRGLTIDELELSEVEPELHGSLRNLEDTAFERHARSLQFVAAISGRSIEHGLASLQLAESVAPGVGGNVGAGATAGQPPSMGATGGPFLGAAMAPGEQAEMAADTGQRQRDRTRRDERARQTPDPDIGGAQVDPDPGHSPPDTADAATEPTDSGSDPAPPEPESEPTSGDQTGETTAVDGSSTQDAGSGGTDPERAAAEGGRSDPEDITVSRADVTPGSVGGNGVSPNGDGADLADLDEEASGASDEATAETSDSATTAPASEGLIDDPESTLDPGSEVVDEDAAAEASASSESVTEVDADPAIEGDAEAATDADAETATDADPEPASDLDPEPEPEPAPEPSPSSSTTVPDDIDATFDDGDVGTVDDTAPDDEAEGLAFDGEPSDLEFDGAVEEDAFEVGAADDRCIALTKAGDRCQRTATEGSEYCHQHAPE